MGMIKVTTISPIMDLTSVANPFHLTNSFNSLSGKNSIIVYPELATTGRVNSLESLTSLYEGTLKKIVKLCSMSKGTIIVGSVVKYNYDYYNCVIVINEGKVKGIVPKCNLESHELGIFKSGENFKEPIKIPYLNNDVAFGSRLLFKAYYDNSSYFTYGIEVGSDALLPNPPSTYLALNGAEVIFNPSIIGSDSSDRDLRRYQSKRCLCAYVTLSSGWGEVMYDDLITTYNSTAVLGEFIGESDQNDFDDYHISYSTIDIDYIRHQRSLSQSFRSQSMNEVDPIMTGYVDASIDPEIKLLEGHSFIGYSTSAIDLQAHWVIRKMQSDSGTLRNMVIGFNGGRDDILALLVALRVNEILIDCKMPNSGKIYLINMPCYGTTDKSLERTQKIFRYLTEKYTYVETKTIRIARSVTQHRKDIELPKEDRSRTYELSQINEREQVLMDYANKKSAIILGTCNMTKYLLDQGEYNDKFLNVNINVPGSLVCDILYNYGCHCDTELCNLIYDALYNTVVDKELIPPTEIVRKANELNNDTYRVIDYFIYHRHITGWNDAYLLNIAAKVFNKYEPNQLKSLWVRFTKCIFKTKSDFSGPNVCNLKLSELIRKV